MIYKYLELAFLYFQFDFYNHFINLRNTSI